MCSSNGTNRVLDITRSGGPVVSGANVKIWTDTDPTSQDFKIIHVSGGKYKIVPLANLNVALTSYGTGNGTSGGTTSTSAGNVFVSTYTGSNNNQLWVFASTTSGITSGINYYVKNKNSGLYLDVWGSQTADHTPVQQYPYGAYPSEYWRITYAVSGYYYMQTMLDTTKYLDATSNPINHSQVQIHSKDGSDEQLWKIIRNTNGTYRLSPKKNEFSMSLCVINASLASNARVITHEYNASQNEQWTFAHVAAFSTMGGLANRTVTIRRRGTATSSTPWLSAITDAINSWNSSGSGTNITTTSSGISDHTIEVDSYLWIDFGRCYKYPLGTNDVATLSIIEINSRTIDSNFNDIEKARRSIIAHEIGHLLWLSDDPVVTNANNSLMNANRNRETVFTPQTYDRDNVRFRYD